MNEDEKKSIDEDVEEMHIISLMAKPISKLFLAFKAEGLSSEDSALLAYKMIETGAKKFDNGIEGL